MATTFPVLGQSAPLTGGTEERLVGAVTGYAVVSSITIANRSATTTDYYYVRVAQGGDPEEPKQYVAHKVGVGPSTVTTLKLGLTLAASDEVWVKSDNATCSFNAFGSLVD